MNKQTDTIYNFAKRAAMTIAVMLMTAASATAQNDITQCTVTGLKPLIFHAYSNESTGIEYQNIVVKDGETTLTEGTDYTLQIELPDGTTRNLPYYDYWHVYDVHENETPTQTEYYIHDGDVLNEKLVVTGTGSYTGVKKVAYRKFICELSKDDEGYNYKIHNADELELIRECIIEGYDFTKNGATNGNHINCAGFRIAGNIDYTGRPLTIDGDGDGIADSNFQPIGTADNPFNTIFRCNVQTYHFHTLEERAADPHVGLYMPDPFTYRTISGIVCKTKGDAPAGLFGCLASGVSVSDVTLDNCTFTASGKGVAGAIAGTVANGATVERCLVKNSTVSGTTQGVIVGSNSGTLSRNYYTVCNSNASNIGTGAGDVDGARRDVGLTVPGSLSLDEGTTHGLVFDGSFYGGAGETLTFYEDTFDAYTTTGPVASFTHDAANYKYALAIKNDAAAAITINHANHFGTDAGADGSEEHPYIITTTAGLDFLAELVNGDPNESWSSRYKFKNKYIKLGADIAYNPSDKTFDLDGNSTNESNFKPIAICRKKDSKEEIETSGVPRFLGTFDGDGHTISGIRIDYTTGYGLGIFGLIGYADADGTYGSVKNLSVSNTVINGYMHIGGIVGYQLFGDVTNCHVTNTVSLQVSYVYGGGIISYIGNGTISNCTSAATLSHADASATNQLLGGIAAYVGASGLLSNNIAYGVTISGSPSKGTAAIVGYGSTYDADRISHNYYSNCNIGEVTKGVGYFRYDSTNKVYTYSDETANDGAVSGFALYDDGDNSKAIVMAAAGGGSIDVKLVGRTLYKDGAWNTLCLPFSLSAEQVTAQLAPAALMTLGSSSFTDGALTLEFEVASEIEAGKPYLIKWAGQTVGGVIGGNSGSVTNSYNTGSVDSQGNLVNPVFSGVTVSTASAKIQTDYVDFIGSTSPVTLTANDRTKLFLGAGSTLYYPSDDLTLNACRAYFELKGITAGDKANEARSFILNFGEESSGVTSPLYYREGQGAEPSWFSLDGRRLNGKPTAKGIYINNNKKIYIK